MASKSFKIKYIGRKSEFWELLQETVLKNVKNTEVEFSSFEKLGLPPDQYKPYDPSEMIEFFSTPFNLMLVEMSDATQDLIDLIKLYHFTFTQNKQHVASVWDNSTERWDIIKQNQLKWSAGFFIDNKDSVLDCARSVVTLLKMESDAEHIKKFELNEKLKIFSPAKVVTVNPDEVVIESDITLGDSAVMELETNFFRNFPSDKFIVDSYSEAGVLNNYKFRIVLNYLFKNAKDEIIQGTYQDDKILEYLERTLEVRGLSSDATNETIDEIMGEYSTNKEIAESKKYSITKWINENKSQAREDFPRIFIIDPDTTFLTSTKKPIWNYPYKFFISRFFKSQHELLSKMKPNIIVYNMVEDEDAEKKYEKIYFLINSLKKEMGLEPHIYVMGLKLEEVDLVSSLNYPYMMVHPPTETSDKLFTFVREYLDQKYVSPTDSRVTGRNDAYYVKGHAKESDANIEMDIEIKGLSEEEIEFVSDIQIPMYTSLFVRLNETTQFYMTYYDSYTKDDVKIKKGLIHSLNEVTKSHIRKFINLRIRDRELAKKEGA